MHANLQSEAQLGESDVAEHTHARDTWNPTKMTSPLLHRCWECAWMQCLWKLVDGLMEICQSHDPAPQLSGIRAFHEYILRTCINSQQSFLQSPWALNWQMAKHCSQRKCRASFLSAFGWNIIMGFLVGSVGKESACNAGDPGDMGSVPESGRFPGRGHSNPLQYSCLENPTHKRSLVGYSP